MDEKFALPKNEELLENLPQLAEDIVQTIFAQDPEHGQDLAGAFVSSFLFAVTRQEIRNERRVKQAEGIAAAKARGVRFGVPKRTLPDNFDQVRVSWRNHEMNLKEAAKMCGMPATTFYDAVRRAETAEL